LACAALCGCSGGSSSGGAPNVVSWGAGCTESDGGLCSFPPAPDPGPGGVRFAASGEVLALQGYPFPPVNPGDVAFVDGWAVTFTRLLVTVDDVELSNNPDISPGDESQTGSLIAEVQGPWAIDLAHSDPNYLIGKGGAGEEAVPIASLPASSSFATDGTRYAFGFGVVTATDKTADGRETMNVNLDADGLADYALMTEEGCTVLYVGTATFAGGTVSGFETCNDAPEYQNWPTTVPFRLCFQSPTTYINCQNPDNDPATPLDGEEHERGIAFKSNESVIAQVTIHTDHPFWDSTLHDSPAHFDQFAARAVGQDAGAPVTLDATRGVDYTAYTDALGNQLQWRYCIAPPTDVHAQFSGAMAFDAHGVPACTNGPSTGLCDYHDFTTYDQSTQGHLNSDGLCFVRRNYPSPP
jgi:hypothetical protein